MDQNRWTPQGEAPQPSTPDTRADGIYITPQSANAQLVELLRKVLPENKFITPEMLVPLLTIVATLVMSKFEFDKEQVLQTVQDVNGQVVTTYNKWVPLAMALLYMVLGGGSLAFSGAVVRSKERSRQEAATAVRSMMVLETERERSRNLEITNRNLKMQYEVQERALELERVRRGFSEKPYPHNEQTYSDVSPDLKVADQKPL